MKFFGYIRDGAIIQKDKEFIVRGYGEGKVKCVLEKEGFRTERIAESTNGKFSVVFPAVGDVKEYYTLSADNGNESVSVKVKFGDVYLMMGQSNMSYPLSAVEDCEEWRRRAEKSDVSVLNLHEPDFTSLEELERPVRPLDDFCREYSWIGGNDEQIKNISAITVQLSTLISEDKGEPVGAVHTAMGGLGVETYLRRKHVEENQSLKNFLKSAGRYQSEEEYNKAGARNYSQIAGVWNEKIEPLKGIGFAGIVWYLGESSAYDYEYSKWFYIQLKYIIEDLKEMFGNIPFAAVHIAQEYYPYGDNYGYLYINEQIHRLASEFDNVFDVPIYDVEPRWLKYDRALYYHPIHTVNKSPVSERIKRAVEGKRFPEISSVGYSDCKAVCKIKNCESLSGRYYNGFTIRSGKGKFYPAKAERISFDEIEVYSSEVKNPSEITYAFMQYQDFCNVKDAGGLPLIPYRTASEPVDEKYFFPPAFSVNGKTEVYENCFGWQIGSCMKVPIWKSGEIYRSKKVEISSTGSEIVIKAEPVNEEYFIFGISPSICLSGHNNHISDFRYWNFDLRSDKPAEFLGVVMRRADGQVFRCDLKNGNESVEKLNILDDYKTFCVDLTRGLRGDSSPFVFGKRIRKQFVQAELIFRAETCVNVCMSNFVISDKNFSKTRRAEKKIQKLSAETNLSQN